MEQFSFLISACTSNDFSQKNKYPNFTWSVFFLRPTIRTNPRFCDHYCYLNAVACNYYQKKKKIIRSLFAENFSVFIFRIKKVEEFFFNLSLIYFQRKRDFKRYPSAVTVTVHHSWLFFLEFFCLLLTNTMIKKLKN